mmetsp:Transcript_8542/g.25704  ORF Transcript_8542/g.25704 Transcript_8542/m.25704 type:complete len:187 (+) Transcript_8542:557-1117(+)
MSRGAVELAALGADPRTIVALGGELARDPAVQAAVLDRLAEATAPAPSRPPAAEVVAQPEAESVCGGAAQLAAAASAEQLEALRREVDQLKRQLRVLLEERRGAPEPPRRDEWPAPLEAPGRCLAGSVGVATLLLTQCVFRRQQQQQGTCSLAAALGSCSAAVANVANCLAAPGQFEGRAPRDVRA